MNTLRLSLCLSLAFAVAPAPRAADSPAGKRPAGAARAAATKRQTMAVEERKAGRVEGELLVKFDAKSAPAAPRRAHARAGAQVLREFPALGWQLVRLPRALSVERALELYRADPGVLAAQPNYSYRLAATPNDPRYASGEQYGLQKIGAPAAWDASTGSPAVVVAVIDTGIKYTHEDLLANVWTNPGETPANGIDDDANGYIDDLHGADTRHNDGDPMDDHGHGTHVAGIIGAAGNNGVGVAGVNWSVRLLGVKMFDAAGVATTATAVAALQYVTLMRERGTNIRVANSSWGGAPEAPSEDPALKEAFRAAGAAGVVNVCAAGNQGRDTDAEPFYPASFRVPNVVSVAASDANDNRASFSNYGATSVDLAAPGVSILSTLISASNYGFLSGTSMAAPHVAGAAALLAAADPTLSAASLKATLLNTATPLPQWSRLSVTGGRLNLAGALAAPTACSFALSATSAHFAAAGGAGVFTVDAAANCDWAARSSDSWLTVAAGGSGGGAVEFAVAPNAGAPRAASITVAGQTFSVTQEAPPTVAPGQLVISEFRIDGPAGAADEFYELYNNTDAPLAVSAADGSAGWSLAARLSTGGGASLFTQILCTVPAGAVVPARGHYLCTQSHADAGGAPTGYSLADYGGPGAAAGDQNSAGPGLAADGAAVRLLGLALFRTADPAHFDAAHRLDAVGTDSSNVDPVFAEGAPIPYAGEYDAAAQFSWLRKLSGGRPQDTGDSLSDFVLVSGSGAALGAAQSTLGAPGPENSASPVQRNAGIKASLIDQCAASSAPPNRVRDTTADPDPAHNSTFGTLTVRRKFTNSTGAPVTSLRFRIVDVTTAPAASGAADLRARTSQTSFVSVSAACGGASVQVRGLTLEEPPAQSSGGGLNSTLAAGNISLAAPLAAGGSINVQFLLGVRQTGTFRFFINVEALP